MKPYNSYIVCVKTYCPFFTKGKIYNVVNGNFYSDKNSLSLSGRASSIKEINERVPAEFIEIVE